MIFKKKKEELYLLTNYKVMFSSFKQQKSLESKGSSNLFFRKVLLSHIHLHPSKYYLIVRNPYKRIASFFKDKFRLNAKEKKGKWQDCQSVFFPFLEIDEFMPTYLISDKIRKVSFPQFIALLPEVYQLNDHLYPQCEVLKFTHKTCGIQLNIPIKCEKIFKMESNQDLKKLAEIFNIDIGIRANSTHAYSEQLVWRHQERMIVDKIYNADFKRFGYEKINAK